MWATLIYTFAFTAVGIIALLMFGSEIKSDFLQNMATRTGSISLFIRTTYCFILLLHIPYFFFSVKEYALVMYDEFFNRSLSTHLEEKLE